MARRLLALAITATFLCACEGMESQSFCEQKWDENKATASGGYMTRDRYIENCETTNEQIRNGDWGG